MLKKALYLGMVVVTGWKFLQSIDRYHAHRRIEKKKEHKEALNVWEAEGGNPAGVAPKQQAVR